MKSYPVFILLLANSFFSNLNACGFYPFGEEVRFCFLDPAGAGYDSYWQFNYTSDWHYGNWDQDDKVDYEMPNILLWRNYCKGRVADEAIRQAIYTIPLKDVKRQSKNAMLKYLYGSNDMEAINYIIFAKRCEGFNWGDDLWEREEEKASAAMDALMKEGIALAGKATRKELHDKYLFLSARISRYSRNATNIKTIYEKHFKDRIQKDIVDYWVLYFYLQFEKDPARKNYYAAQVFANAPDKRFAVRLNYDREIPIEETLKYAANKKEAANIWMMQGIRVTGKALSYMEGVYKNDPSAEALGFMLLREVNKLEDWILTPRYSLFEPSIRDDYWENDNAQRILARVENDRKYAAQVLAFVNRMDISKVDNPQFVRLAQAYLNFLVKDNAASILVLNKLERQLPKGSPMYRQAQLIRGLAITAGQQEGKAVIPAAIQNLLMEKYKELDYHYIFAIARELEDKGNSTDAALLFFKANHQQDWENHSTVYWKTRNDVTSMFSDFYTKAISYIDAVYSPEKVRDLLDRLEAGGKRDSFGTWLYSDALTEKHELQRIEGTLYLRMNKLPEAYKAFSAIDTQHQFVFADNPFYKIWGTPSFVQGYRKTGIDRAYIIGNLMDVLNRANNPAEKERDYYYFQAANCYYNMSFFGNAWNMRRRYKSATQFKTGLADDDEFYGCRTAEKYYALALKHAKTRKFRALCLRMLSQCEKNNSRYITEKEYVANGYRAISVYGVRQYDYLLRKNYSEYYGELTSNCNAFRSYFKARR